MGVRKDIRTEIARSAGLMDELGAVSAVANLSSFTVPKAADLNPDAQRTLDSYLFLRDRGEYRRVTSYDPATGTFTVNRNFAAVQAGDAVELYYLLTPDDWNAVINDTVRQLWYVSSKDATLFAGAYSYTIIDVRPEEVKDVRFIRSGVGNEFDSMPASEYRLEPRDDDVVVHFVTGTIPDPSAWFLRVYILKRGEAMTSDQGTTQQETVWSQQLRNIPRDLWFWGSVFHGLVLVKGKFGPQVGRLFDQRIVLAEREFNKAKQELLPRLSTREYHWDEVWQGPDVNPNLVSPGW